MRFLNFEKEPVGLQTVGSFEGKNPVVFFIFFGGETKNISRPCATQHVVHQQFIGKDLKML